MQSIRTGRIALAAATATLIVAATAPAASAPGPTATLTSSVSPNHLVGRLSPGHGMPITLSYDARINHPAGSTYQLQKVVVKFPAGVGKPNGNLFPSCSVAQLKAAHNRLSACPKGSKIGSGKATGTAVALNPPVTSSGVLTLFNGPKGKSITFNVDITTPAFINDTFSAPLKKLSGGKYGYVLTNVIPADLQTILDGPIIVREIKVKSGLTRVVRGVKRGYIEAYKCPKSHKAPIHSDFFFSQGATASADANISCH
jgi:hypothetical protein